MRGSSKKPAADAEAPPAAGSSPIFSQSFFQSVVESANEGIWMVDLEGITFFANDRMAAMLGTSTSEMVGKPAFNYCFEEDLPRARELMGKNFAGVPAEFEMRFRRPDGSEIPVLAGSAPIRDEHGAIIGSVAMFSDLTARKAIERELVKREQEATHTAALLDQLLESAPDPIWLRDSEGRFQVVNEAAARVMGRKQTDVVGASIDEIWAKQAPTLHAQAKQILDSRTGIAVEEQMFDAARNSVRTYLSNKVPLFAGDGSPIGILGVSRDITDLKQVENDLRASKARLAQQVSELNALYDSAPIGLAFFSRDYRYLRINRELAAINGLSVEEHIGRTIREVLSDSAPAVEPIIDQVFATGTPLRDIEVSAEAPNEPGIERHWLTGFYPVFGGSGEVEAVGAWVVEISERKASEQREVLLAREVDHRAKNLLAVVQSIVQLTPVTDAADLKASVVGRIQALARAHSLLSESRWNGVDLGQLVGEELAPFATDGTNRISHSGPPLMLRPAAAQSLALVLHELATNAAKYGGLSNPRGQVAVEWRRKEDSAGARIEIDWVESGGPKVSAPGSFGFGSNIIRASVERQLRGKVSKEWRPEGLLCTLRIPAAEVAPRADG